MIQFQAMCAWYEYWLDGVRTHDAQAVASARAMAGGFKTWQTVLTSDQQFRAYLTDIAARATLGDYSGLQEMIRNNC